MKFIFWQNVVSIHQVPFLKSLSSSNEVVLIVEKEIDEFRQNQGWTIPELGNIKLIIHPTDMDIDHIIKKNPNAFHFFSGFSLNKMLNVALKKAIQNKTKYIGVILEPFNNKGFTGFLRKIKYTIYAIKYRNKIKALLVTGKLARSCYESVGFSNNKIYDWAYFTKENQPKNRSFSYRTKKNLLFVGSINERKNLLGVIDGIIENLNYFNEFYIVGSGNKEFELKNKIEGIEKVKLLGNITNNEVNKIMNKSDILILPSIFDGWGAVVNEGLQNGNQVLVSDDCGSSILVDGNERGEVFSNSKNDFSKVLKKWLTEKPLDEEQRISIMDWSSKSISPKVIPFYFQSIINHVINQSDKKPTAPWI
ncbi:glycosyltransferase [Aquimarina agarivorans]|uniref:glycosyltransferase n=1 Tax=Aquimarina agarivorans TaxID=980584 RepID=UPI000248EB64|nr:glycosyltransferase [Aquimarina agarivorans]